MISMVGKEPGEEIAILEGLGPDLVHSHRLQDTF